MSSHSKIINVGDESNKDCDISADGAVRRINSVCGRTTSTMIPASVKGIHHSNEKALDDQHSSIHSVRSITFEQWCKQKEMMQRLKDQLIEDAKLEILESMKENQNSQNKSDINWESFKNWSQVKDKELRMLKLEKKRAKMIKQMNRIKKQERAERAFKAWLKASLIKAKQEKYHKTADSKAKQARKLMKRQADERKKVEAEISYKRWKAQKDKQQREEKRIKRLERWRDQEREMMLKEQRRMRTRDGNVMLAYSMNH